MHRYKLTIEYQGTHYSGWQRQPDVPTIQQAIEEAIHKFSGQNAELTVAGRTDAGVHAKGQVAHVDFDNFTKPMDEFSIMKAINAHLRPQPISIIAVERTSDEFNARFDAKNKLYQYRIINRAAFLTLDQGTAWLVPKVLDIKAMQAGANHLLGHHDFSTFRDSECQANSPLRTLDRIDIQQNAYPGGSEIQINVEAQSFLHHQVRNIVGTLSLVGLGKWQPEDVKTTLEAKDRTKGGPTAPADGLYLVRIDYEK